MPPSKEKRSHRHFIYSGTSEYVSCLIIIAKQIMQDRYHAFMRMVREWQHVRLLKRMGRGHAKSGVRGTKEGDCAVICPACPIPSINLPLDWQERPESEQ